MNIKSLLKKYGMIIIVALLFTGAIIYFAVDSNKGVIRGKQENGKDVVVSLSGYNVTADTLYDTLMQDSSYASYSLYLKFVNEVVSASTTATEDMQTSAELQAESLINSFKSEYGDSYSEYLQAALVSAGLEKEEDLVGYYLNYYMLQDMIEKYTEEHKEELFDEFYEEKSPRLVSHILVKMEDSENPTAEEKAKMDAIDAALKEGKTFAEVAKEMSDDSSASNGGSLGYVDADTSFVEPFLTTALELNSGEMSEWVQTEYGYHLILVDDSTKETMIENEDASEALSSYYSYLELTVIKEAASKLEITYASDEIKAMIDEFLAQAD
ncbi:MAG: peptidylprolyl isomerase [Erysipelotrichales bacterium]|nr:peptidylprolyl isomerase [Erysipelotrichales bacterium]